MKHVLAEADGPLRTLAHTVSASLRVGDKRWPAPPMPCMHAGRPGALSSSLSIHNMLLAALFMCKHMLLTALFMCKHMISLQAHHRPSSCAGDRPLAGAAAAGQGGHDGPAVAPACHQAGGQLPWPPLRSSASARPEHGHCCCRELHCNKQGPNAHACSRDSAAHSACKSWAVHALSATCCAQELKRLLDDDEDMNDMFLHRAQQLPASPLNSTSAKSLKPAQTLPHTHQPAVAGNGVDAAAQHKVSSTSIPLGQLCLACTAEQMLPPAWQLDPTMPQARRQLCLRSSDTWSLHGELTHATCLKWQCFAGARTAACH